jgi:outer membrane protein assembly factor BamB
MNFKLITLATIFLFSNFIFFTDLKKENDTINIPFTDELLQVVWSQKIDEYHIHASVIIDNLIFLDLNEKYCYDKFTGKKLYYDSISHRNLIKTLCRDSLLFYENSEKSFLINIYTGKKIQVRKNNINIKYSHVRPIKDNYFFALKNYTTIAKYNIIENKFIGEIDSAGFIISMIEDKNNIYTSSYEGNIYKISKKSFTIEWSKNFHNINSNFIIKNKLLLFSSWNGLNALNYKTGDSIWFFQNETSNSINLVNSGDTIYYIKYPKLLALDCNTGDKIWEYSISHDYFDGELLQVFDNYIVIYWTENILVINKKTGLLEYANWKTERFNIVNDGSDPSIDWENPYSIYTIQFSKQDGNYVYGSTVDSLYCFKILK